MTGHELLSYLQDLPTEVLDEQVTFRANPYATPVRVTDAVIRGVELGTNAPAPQED